MSLKKKGKGFISEFRDFIMRGNVIDMAVGVIIATSFGKITTSLVNDVIMPFIGWFIGDIDLSAWNIILVEEVLNEAGEVVTPAVIIGIGTFLVTVIDFLIIAFIVFLIIKFMAKAKELAEMRKKKEEEIKEEAPKGPTTEELLSEILAEIKKNKE